MLKKKLNDILRTTYIQCEHREKKIQADVTFQKGYSDYLQLVLN